MTGAPETDAVIARAEMLNELGRHAEALDQVGRALAGEPHNPGLLRQGAVANLGLGDIATATEMLNAAIAADPDAPAAFVLMSIALQMRGLPDQAVHAARRAVVLNPYAAVTHAQLARALSAFPHCHEEALSAADLAVGLEPHVASHHLARVEVLLPEGHRPDRERLAAAEASVRRALELDPRDAAALNDLARVQMARGRNIGAAGTLNRAVVGSPNVGVLHQNMDAVLAQMIAVAHWTLFVAFFVLARATDGFARGPVVAVAVLSVGLLSALVIRLAVKLEGRMVAFVTAFARRRRLSASWGACLVLSALALVAAAVAPADLGDGLLVAAAVALVLGAVVSWVQFFRDRRTA